MSASHKAYLLYGATTMSYGFIRKIPLLYDAKVESYNWKDHKDQVVPMLLTTKVLIAGISGLSGVCYWPIYIHNDISRMEIYSKGYNPDDYNYKKPKDLFDYMFM
jgi:hypothetical protein